MMLRVGRGGVTLEDVENFKQFKVVANCSIAELEAIATDGNWGALAKPDHIWLDADFIKERSGHGADQTWLTAFSQMTDYARKQGWVLEDPERIRAHIDWE